MIINVFKAEFKKYIEEVKCYYPDHIVGIIVTYILFLGFFISFSNTSLARNNLHIGFIFWFFATSVISEGSMSISYEKQTGTFEQLLLKPVDILLILSIRTGIWFIVTFIKVVILMFMVMLTLGMILPFDIRIIPILLITLVGLYRFGMMLAGSTLVFTKTASFESIFSYFLLFFTGGIVALEQLPPMVSKVSKILPLTLGINISQQILKGHVVTLYNVLVLLLNSIIYLVIGILVFTLAYRYSRIYGLNSKY